MKTTNKIHPYHLVRAEGCNAAQAAMAFPKRCIHQPLSACINYCARTQPSSSKTKSDSMCSGYRICSVMLDRCLIVPDSRRHHGSGWAKSVTVRANTDIYLLQGLVSIDAAMTRELQVTKWVMKKGVQLMSIWHKTTSISMEGLSNLLSLGRQHISSSKRLGWKG